MSVPISFTPREKTEFKDISKLTQEKLDIEQEIIHIESRLHKAKSKARTTGVYADAEWFNKITNTLNQKKLRLKELNITISAMQKSERKHISIDAILNGDFNRKSDLKVVGVYLDPRIAETLDKLGKQGGRGAKSWVVNEALKQFFENNSVQLYPQTPEERQP